MSYKKPKFTLTLGMTALGLALSFSTMRPAQGAVIISAATGAGNPCNGLNAFGWILLLPICILDTQGGAIESTRSALEAQGYDAESVLKGKALVDAGFKKMNAQPDYNRILSREDLEGTLRAASSDVPDAYVDFVWDQIQFGLK